MVHQGAWHKQQNNTRQLLAHSRYCEGGGENGWGPGIVRGREVELRCWGHLFSTKIKSLHRVKKNNLEMDENMAAISTMTN